MAPRKPFDAIIIGSGMGGLTVASLLARKGWNTLLFEKEHQVGGYVVSFNRQGRVFDATGAFVGGCQEGGTFYEILKEIGALEEVNFIPVHHIRNVYPGFEVNLRQGGMEAYADALLRLFPEEEKGLKAYLSLVRGIGEEIQSYSKMTLLKKILFPLRFHSLIRFHRTNHQSVLDRLFKGREIKMALHTLPTTEPPSRLSFLFVATLISKALMEGVFYPKGGMGRISEAMGKAFQRSGGEIHLRTGVGQVLVKGGRIEGILTEDGRVFQAPVVISDINPNHLVRMLPDEYQKTLFSRMERFEYSLSCFILYLATDLDVKGLNLPYFTYLRFLSDLEQEGQMFQRGEIPRAPTMIVSIPTLLDPALAPTGQHLLKVLVPVPFHYQEAWQETNLSSYLGLKEEFTQRILQQLEGGLLPRLRNHLLFHEAATPVTLRRYTGNEQGAMYGLASTPHQIGNFRPSHRTPLPGLFQVGHYTRPAHGIVGASLSGLFAARMLLRKGTYTSML